ncbi:hypothetical protein [Lapillicoccus sp.]
MASDPTLKETTGLGRAGLSRYAPLVGRASAIDASAAIMRAISG